MTVSENYLDTDVAYFLGLIVARGSLIESQGDRKIVIDFPYKSLTAEGITKKYSQEDHLYYSISQLRERLIELTESHITINKGQHNYTLLTRFLRNSMVWRNIRYLLKDGTNYFDFQVPYQIFEAGIDIKKEFLRGVADCAGFIRNSNNYMGGKRRVYIEISNKNWFLPVQLCELFQRHLNVRVHAIQWGHPNTREPSKRQAGRTWAREHQIKIFSEAFEPVGFYVKYKQEILDEFIKADRKLPGNIAACNPNPGVRRIIKKPKHPEESNKNLPAPLKGKHFNTYWQICLALGCKQCIKVPKTQLALLKEFPEDFQDGEDK